MAGCLAGGSDLAQLVCRRRRLTVLRVSIRLRASPSVRPLCPPDCPPHHLLAAFEVHYNVNGGDNVTYLQLFFILEHSVMPTKRKLYKRMCQHSIFF